MTKAWLLEAEKIKVRYGRMEALHSVSIKVGAGQIVTVIGPNGAGKTTLIKLICGELLPTKGQIKKNQHLKISRFTQHFEEKLDLSMTPLDFFKQVVMPTQSIEQIRPLLGRYGCTGDMQSQVMNQLSAGQKARIVFAIIAWERPHLLLLDEPVCIYLMKVG